MINDLDNEMFCSSFVCPLISDVWIVFIEWDMLKHVVFSGPGKRQVFLRDDASHLYRTQCHEDAPTEQKQTMCFTTHTLILLYHCETLKTWIKC